MSRQRDFIRKDIVIPDLAVMCKVNANHEEVARPDSCHLPFTVSSMKSTKFSDQVVVADYKAAMFTFERNVLRFTSEDRVFVDFVSGADFSETLDDRVCANLTALANIS